YDFGDVLTNIQHVHGELAYQILYQRDRALSFSRNQLVQEATKVPPQAFEAFMKGVQTQETDPTREIFLKNAMRLYAKENGRAVYSQAAFELGRFYMLRSSRPRGDRKSTRLNSSHVAISYAVFCLKKKKNK